MCIHDQCDTILVSVDQRIIMPPLTSLSVPNKPFSQNTNITNIQQPPKLSKTSSRASQATRQPGRCRPVQDGERRGVASDDQAGPGWGWGWPLLRLAWASYTARRAHPTRPGLAEREREARRGTNPGDGDRRPRPRESQEGPSAAPSPGRSIPAKAHCQFTHDKPFRVRSCPYWSSWVASSWLSSSQPNLSGCFSRDHSLWPAAPSPGRASHLRCAHCSQFSSADNRETSEHSVPRTHRHHQRWSEAREGPQWSRRSNWVRCCELWSKSQDSMKGRQSIER